MHREITRRGHFGLNDRWKCNNVTDRRNRGGKARQLTGIRLEREERLDQRRVMMGVAVIFLMLMRDGMIRILVTGS